MSGLQEGYKLSHYRILQELGAGGMGEVYLAEDTRLERKVALKVLPAQLASNQERMGRFVQEAKAASGLNHPNIAHIYEIGEVEGVNFIAMEFVDGELLNEKIYGGQTDLRTLLKYLAQVAEGLAKAHAAGIVHRDLKPDNIMISRDGFAKILDFGLAKLVESPKPEQNADDDEFNEAATEIMPQPLSTPGMIMGTVGYMSPEQAQGRSEIDQRSDVFSFGCVLFEAATGRQPFKRDSVIDTLHNIIHAPAPSIQDFNPDAPTELQRIIRRCLAKDPDERFQSIKDLAIELKELHREMNAEIHHSISPLAVSNGEDASTSLGSRDEAKSRTSTTTAHPTSSAEYITGDSKRHKSRLLAGLSILLLIVVGFGYWFYAQRLISNDARQIESIAVLPFENASGDAELDYLSDGVSESVIDRLSQLPQLKVIARSSSFRYRGQNLDFKEIAAALGVDAVVTGRVVPRGDSYQIRVELVDARENKHLWGETFTRRASDVQILQTDISREIAEILRLHLSGTQAQQFAGQETTNPQAYELLLRGRFYFNKAGEPENFQKAVEFFEQAIALDPNYALAYAVLVETYSFGGISRGLTREQHEMKLEAAARKALELDPNLAEAHNSMAVVKRNKWEWEETERSYLRAIELNPNLPQAHSGYAFYLNLMGRHDQALDSIKRARALDPVSLIINTSVGVINLRMQRYDEAIEASKKAIQLGERAMFARRTLGTAYAAKGMFSEAVAEYEEAIKIAGGDSPGVEALLGVVYAKTGQRAKAEEILQRLKAAGSRLPPEVAALYDALGMSDEALAVLEKAYSDRLHSLPYIAVDPSFENFRSDPRFQGLLRRMGLPA